MKRYDLIEELPDGRRRVVKADLSSDEAKELAHSVAWAAVIVERNNDSSS